MDIYQQLNASYGSLSEFKATDDVSDSVGEVFDALLAAAKEAQPATRLSAQFKRRSAVNTAES